MSYTDLTAEVEETVSQLQELSVMMPSPAEVREYLFHYSDVIECLLAVSSEARKAFGTARLLFLRVRSDTETGAEYLMLYIHQEHYNEAIAPEIERILAEYEEKFAGKSGQLSIATDFELRFAGLDLDYYKQQMSPNQFRLLIETVGVFPAPEGFDPEETFYPEDL